MANKVTRIDRTDATSLNVNEARPRRELPEGTVTQPTSREGIIINHEEMLTPPDMPEAEDGTRD